MTATKALSAKDMNGLKITNLGAPTAASNDAARKVDVESAYTAAISRANHTGSQLASTISDFDAQVRTSRLDQMAVPTASVSMNSRLITNLLDPTNAQEAATKNYVDTAIAGLVTGQTLKGSVRAVSTANITIASPGATIDGLTAASGEIFLLAGQSTGSQNGPYVWNGAAVPMTRATNWDASAEAVLGSYWIVREGTKADNFALLTNDSTITLGTTTPTFTYLSAGGASIGRYNVDCGAISAGANWTISHNLGSTDVHVQFKRVASPFDFVDLYATTSDANTILANPDVALSSGEFRAIVKY